jgi:hypothetical protein
MRRLESVRPVVRQTIFDVVVGMAWADSLLGREEILAVQAVADALDLPTSPEGVLDELDRGAKPMDRLPVGELDPDERRLVFLCAGWLSAVDRTFALGEEGFLDALAQRLGLGENDADRLLERARDLHRTTAGAVPWWQEFERLLASLPWDETPDWQAGA